MSNPTSNFGWQMPTATDLVTDLPADFEVFGQAVDTSLADLKGGTTGQILSKTTNADMDFTWIANDQGDITEITATSPLTGGGTSGAITVGIQDGTTTQKGAVQLENSTSSTSTTKAAVSAAVKSAYDLADAAIAKSTVTTAGDIIYRNATVPTRLGIGTAGQVLTVNAGATAPEWKTATSGASFAGCSLYKSATQNLTNNAGTILTFNTELIDVGGYHDTSTNTSRITIPSGKAGYYQISAKAAFLNNATGIRVVYILLNGGAGAIALASQSITSNNENQTVFVSQIYNCAVGDYFEMQVYQNSGTTLTAIAGQSETTFAITYLGA